MGSHGNDRGHGRSGHGRGRGRRDQDKSKEKSSGKSRSGHKVHSSTLMSLERAKAIQSHADRTNTNQDFKARAMSAASKHENNGDFDNYEE
ncbi:MAG: hypothetical protein ACTSPD_20675 [Promethearchaeota archaeon]